MDSKMFFQRVEILLQEKSSSGMKMSRSLGLPAGAFAGWKQNQKHYFFLNYLKDVADYLGVTQQYLLLGNDGGAELTRTEEAYEESIWKVGEGLEEEKKKELIQYIHALRPPMTWRERIFDRIRSLMVFQGYSYEYLGRQLGLDAEIRKWKRAKGFPYMEYIDEIAVTLDSSVEYLVFGKDTHWDDFHQAYMDIDLDSRKIVDRVMAGDEEEKAGSGEEVIKDEAARGGEEEAKETEADFFAPIFQRIEEKQKENGFTARKMSQLLGLPGHAFMDWKKDREGFLFLEHLKEMADILQVSPKYLILGNEGGQPLTDVEKAYEDMVCGLMDMLDQVDREIIRRNSLSQTVRDKIYNRLCGMLDCQGRSMELDPNYMIHLDKVAESLGSSVEYLVFGKGLTISPKYMERIKDGKPLEIFDSDAIFSRVEDKLREQCLTAKKMCFQLGYTERSYARWKNWRKEYRFIDHLEEMAGYLGVTPQYLFWGYEGETDLTPTEILFEQRIREEAQERCKEDPKVELPMGKRILARIRGLQKFQSLSLDSELGLESRGYSFLDHICVIARELGCSVDYLVFGRGGDELLYRYLGEEVEELKVKERKKPEQKQEPEQMNDCPFHHDVIIQRIEDLLKKQGIPSTELSRNLGLSSFAFQAWKSGVNNYGFLEYINDIATFLHTSEKYILLGLDGDGQLSEMERAYEECAVPKENATWKEMIFDRIEGLLQYQGHSFADLDRHLGLKTPYRNWRKNKGYSFMRYMDGVILYLGISAEYMFFGKCSCSK